tara:strand:+ start:268 stop:522 length:255 start_codon:yes stop_codon:yes gene_type:complete
MFEEDKKQVEYRIVNDSDLPPVVMTMTENDEVKVLLNQHHKIWLCLHRKTIAGSAQSLFEKIDMLLTAHLQEQRGYERMDENEL